MVQKVPLRCEFEAGIPHAMTEKLSHENPSVNRDLFRIREG